MHTLFFRNYVEIKTANFELIRIHGKLTMAVFVNFNAKVITEKLKMLNECQNENVVVFC